MEYRKEIVLVLLGAVVGAALSLGLQFFQENSPTVIVILAGLVLLALVTFILLNLMGPIRLTLSRSEWAKLSGTWEGSFWYSKDGSRVEISEELRISQRGRYVTASSVSTSVSGAFPFKSTGYKLRATLHADGILTGSWENVNAGRHYFGTMEATVSRKGQTIEGLWLGIDNTGLRNGEFLWRKS